MIECDAIISPCGSYRYLLTRRWDERKPTLLYIMLNPSTADAFIDDPTITRCMRRANNLGYGGIEVVNLYAWRATDPSELLRADDPIGPENNATIRAAIDRAAMIVAGWGVHADLARAAHVCDMVRVSGRTIECLGTTKHGSPRHPLYVSYATAPMPYGTGGEA